MTAGTIKAALTAELVAAFAGDTAVQVTSGVPDPSAVPDAVAVLGPIGAGRDGEEETFEYVLVVSCYVGGGQSAQATATTRAYALLDTAHTRINANPTLAGTCRVAAVDVEHRTAETVAYSGETPIGRLTEISAAVTAWSGRTLVGSLASAHTIA